MAAADLAMEILIHDFASLHVGGVMDHRLQFLLTECASRAPPAVQAAVHAAVSAPGGEHVYAAAAPMAVLLAAGASLDTTYEHEGVTDELELLHFATARVTEAQAQRLAAAGHFVWASRSLPALLLETWAGRPTGGLIDGTLLEHVQPAGTLAPLVATGDWSEEHSARLVRMLLPLLGISAALFRHERGCRLEVGMYLGASLKRDIGAGSRVSRLAGLWHAQLRMAAHAPERAALPSLGHGGTRSEPQMGSAEQRLGSMQSDLFELRGSPQLAARAAALGLDLRAPA